MQRSVVGGCTSGSPAYDPAAHILGFLKDSWRDGLLHGRESEFIRTLNKYYIPRVPTLICSGDVCGDAHATKNHEHAAASWNCGSDKITVRRQHRNFTKEIGKGLSTFRSGKHLLEVALQAFIGER